MRRSLLTMASLGVLFLFCSRFILASEADELRDRAKAMRKKAAVLAERGNRDQAEQLEREAAELAETAERNVKDNNGRREKGKRPEIDDEAHHLKERIHDLHLRELELREAKASELEIAEVRKQIAGTEQELKQIHNRYRDLPPEIRGQVEKLDVSSRRVHHLRVAAENLKMAEEHDLAHKLMKQAEAMERDVQEARRRLALEMSHGQQEQNVLRELKEEVERLRAEVRELGQRLERR